MKKEKIILATIILLGFILPTISLAVTFTNPAGDFLIDLTNFKKQNTFRDLFLYIINLVIGIVGILSVGFIIYGGIQYITARGDEEQASAGKKTLTNAIIGLIIVVLSYTIVVVIVNALNGKVK